MQNESVRARRSPTAGMFLGVSRKIHHARKGFTDAVVKLDFSGEADKTRHPSPPPAPDGATGCNAAIMQKLHQRRMEPPGRRASSQGARSAVHRSAFHERGRGRPDQNRMTSGRQLEQKQAINPRGESCSPRCSMPAAIRAQSKLQSSPSPTVPDYSALSALHHGKSQGRRASSAERAKRPDIPNPPSHNTINKIPSVDSTTQNNAAATSMDEDLADNNFFKAGPISAGTVGNSRRSTRPQTTIPPNPSPFSLVHERKFIIGGPSWEEEQFLVGSPTREEERFIIGSPSERLPLQKTLSLQRSTSTPTKTSQRSLAFRSRLKSLKGEESSSPLSPNRCFRYEAMDPDEPPDDSFKDFKTAEKKQESLPRAGIEGKLPKAQAESRLPRAKAEGILTRADKEDRLPRAETEGNLPRADKNDDLPRARTEGNLPRADKEDFLPRAGTEANVPRAETEREEYLVKAASRYFGLRLRRRKPKSSDSGSQKSMDATASPTSNESRRKVLPKMMRKVGRALSKKVSQTDDKRAINLKNIIRGILSLQSVKSENALDPQKKKSNKSMSSENTSDSGSGSIDIEDIKAVSPQLYQSILETVAEWCGAPTLEPTEGPVNLRAFSISFRGRPQNKSQDICNIQAGTQLAAEEAFLRDVVEGRIENSSVSSDVSNDNNDEKSAPLQSPAPQIAENVIGTAEVETILQAMDKLCSDKKEPAAAPRQVSVANFESHPLPASQLNITESDSDIEVASKPPGNDFLHLTESEMDSMELNGMKEILRMQGIWIFDWDRCAEITKLSENWKKSSCLQKYLSGAEGLEFVTGERSVKCLHYPSAEGETGRPIECVFLDGVPPLCTSSTLNMKGILTSMGLRTTCTFPDDGSHREELVSTERDRLCVQVRTELSTGERNVSRVYLKRPFF